MTTVTEECDAIARLARLKDHVLLSHVSWETYDALLDICADRRLRHTYDRGRLEFTTRSSVHEIYKSLLGAFVVILAEEFDLKLFLGGELTLRRPDLSRGLEPDQCYWIGNEAKVRGRTELEFPIDPPPDLFVEIEISRSVLDRLEVLAALRVPEVWRFNGEQLQVGLLQPDGQYSWGETSPTFPKVPMKEIPALLDLANSLDHISILKRFRAWVRSCP